MARRLDGCSFPRLPRRTCLRHSSTARNPPSHDAPQARERAVSAHAPRAQEQVVSENHSCIRFRSPASSVGEQKRDLPCTAVQTPSESTKPPQKAVGERSESFGTCLKSEVKKRAPSTPSSLESRQNSPSEGFLMGPTSGFQDKLAPAKGPPCAVRFSPVPPYRAVS